MAALAATVTVGGAAVGAVAMWQATSPPRPSSTATLTATAIATATTTPHVRPTPPPRPSMLIPALASMWTAAASSTSALMPSPSTSPPNPTDQPTEPALRTPMAPPVETISAVHGGSIDHLALTDDGGAAVTSDTAGAIRLWPTLDGAREPVVVVAAHPAALSLVRDHDELVIADLDPAGALEVIRTSAIGAPVSRAAISSERPYALVRATSHALLALRDDQLVDVLDLHGARMGELPVHAGERIADILVRRDRALAIIVDGPRSRVRGRWIELGTALDWGTTTAVLPVDPTLPLALAPDHRRIAGVHVRDHVTEIVDLASGHAVRPPDLDPDADAPDLAFASTPLGFVDNHTLVRGQRGGFFDLWQSNSIVNVDDSSSNELAQITGPNVVADHRVVGGRLAQLALVAPGEPVHYLGYRLPAAKTLRRAGGRLFVGDEDRFTEWAELGDDLGVSRVVVPPAVAGPYVAAIPIDATHGLALSGAPGGPTKLVRFTFGKNQVEELLSGVGTHIEYNEASHIVVLESALGWMFLRVDPRTGEVGPPIETELPGKVYLVDPARAHGRIGIVIEDSHADSDRATVTPIRALCEACRDHVQLGRPQHVRLDYGDREQIDTRHDLVHVADLTPLVRASPDGAHAVIWGNDRVTLRDADGRVRWTVAAPGVTDVEWTDRGELVALAAGVVHLDLETGAFEERHCGWLFGLSNELTFDGVQAVACDAP